jgi:hypothetical protein
VICKGCSEDAHWGWAGDLPSTVVWQKFEHAEAIHGHEGATRFVFIDDEGA